MPDAFDTGEELDLDHAERMSEPELTAEELAVAHDANSQGAFKSVSKTLVISRTTQIIGLVVGIVALGVVVVSIADVRKQVSVALTEITSAFAVDENAGLIFSGLTSEYIEENGKPFLRVEGQITYDRSEPRKIPPIEIVVLSETKQELLKWVIDPPKETITTGTPVPFKALLNSPPAESKEVAIRFGSM